MFRNFALFAVLAAVLSLLVACGDDDTPSAKAQANASTAPATYAHPELLAETTWLKDQLNDKNVVVVDVRKKDSYDANHIPGAVWYDPARLKDDADKLHVISSDAFAKLAGDLGIDNSKTVVTYDDSAGLSAARLWWVLDYYGQKHAKVLNGGWPKWAKDALPESKEVPAVQKATFTAKSDDTVLCAIDYLKDKSAKPDPNVIILDVRTVAEYNGSDVRAAKGGHVPGAINLDWQRSMTDNDPKVWKSAAELAKQFADAGVVPGKQVITYCQTGVRAAHSLFTLKLMGYENVKNYDGSWQEWGNSKDTNIAQ